MLASTYLNLPGADWSEMMTDLRQSKVLLSFGPDFSAQIGVKCQATIKGLTRNSTESAVG